MTIEDIRKLKWNTLYDSEWSSLPKTCKGSFNRRYVSKNDIINFITDKIHSCSRHLCVDYKEFESLVKSENEAFYELLDNLFEIYEGLSVSGAEGSDLNSLKNFFKLPLLPNKNSNPVNEILLSFEKLTDIQKAEVLSRLNLISVKIMDKKILVE